MTPSQKPGIDDAAELLRFAVEELSTSPMPFPARLDPAFARMSPMLKEQLHDDETRNLLEEIYSGCTAGRTEDYSPAIAKLSEQAAVQIAKKIFRLSSLVEDRRRLRDAGGPA